MRASPWGWTGSMSAPCTAAPCYNIESLDHKAPVHLDQCSGDQCHHSRETEGPSREIKMDYRSLQGLGR